jgi:hypothetical protein
MTGATPRHHPLRAYRGEAHLWLAECAEFEAGAHE